MTNSQLKEDIIAYSKKIGIDKIKFTSADPFVTLKDRLEEQQRLGYDSGFETGTIEERTEPGRLLPEAKTIISIALAYPSKMKNPPRATKGSRRGIFCRASWGEDYHHILRRKLAQLEAYILEKEPDVKCLSMVDTGELSDRAVAERAGIGWSGKNCSIITPEFGSFVYLGELLTTVSLPIDQPIEDQCGDCNKCVEACPTSALVQGGQIDANRCLAFLTQTKDILEDKYREKIGNRLYGCDTCQVVCPKNKGKDFHHHREMEPDPNLVKPELIPLLKLSNREFKEKYGMLAGAWRGKKPIQRNAIIGLAHFKERAALPTLFNVVKSDPRPDIRGIAAWSIGKIGGQVSAEFLMQIREKEKDPLVLQEISKGLALLTNTES